MSTTAPSDEFADALLQFSRLVDPKFVEALQPAGVMAIYTPWVVVWLMIYQRLQQNASLQSAVGELLKIVGELSENKRVREGQLSANTSAYSRARSRLELTVADKIAERVFDSMIHNMTPTLAGRHVFTLDGTTLSLSSAKELRERWPAAPNQHGPGVWPICHAVMAHEVSNGFALRPEVGAMFGPDAMSELKLAIRLLPRIPAKSVLMADRNFGIFRFVHAAVNAAHDVLTRLTGPRFKAMVCSAESLGPGRWQLCWRPSKTERRKSPEIPADAKVQIYLHEFVGFSGKTMWVATTLDISTEQVAAKYAERWNGETDIRQLKKTLQADAMRGTTPDMVLKELAISMVTFNLVLQVRRLAAASANLSPRRISFANTHALVTTMLLSAETLTAAEWEKRFAMVLRGVAQRKLPNRPNRSYPRQVLTRSQKYPKRRPDDKAAPK